MTASTGSVGSAVESIAAISEEDSAAAEEISWTAEQMRAGTGEVVGAAHALAALAQTLDAFVARFRLDATPAPGAVGVGRRGGTATRDTDRRAA
jgi:methyl-accepting chemotaxis protein